MPARAPLLNLDDAVNIGIGLLLIGIAVLCARCDVHAPSHRRETFTPQAETTTVGRPDVGEREEDATRQDVDE